ncbi:unnamed protein product [Rotaria magnacalcarata]
MLNTKDRRCQQILIDLGFIEQTQLITAQDEGLTDDEENDKMSKADYDVQELLTATIEQFNALVSFTNIGSFTMIKHCTIVISSKTQQ